MALVVDAGSDVVDDDELVVDAVLVVVPVVTSSASSLGSITARAIATKTASTAPIASQVLRVSAPIIGPRFGQVLLLHIVNLVGTAAPGPKVRVFRRAVPDDPFSRRSGTNRWPCRRWALVPGPADAGQLVGGDERHVGQSGGARSVDERGPSLDVQADRSPLRTERIIEVHGEVLLPAQ
ncbi:MAG: hypothetical protein ACRD0R_04695 [Acidimicrobiales bacterium]